MSDQVPPRAWRFYIDDMIGFAGRVIAYTDGMDRNAFVTSRLTYGATLRNLELISEAARNIPDSNRADYPQITLRLVIAARKRLIHGHLGIDNDTLWSIITEDVPSLLDKLQHLE